MSSPIAAPGTSGPKDLLSKFSTISTRDSGYELPRGALRVKLTDVLECMVNFELGSRKKLSVVHLIRAYKTYTL